MRPYLILKPVAPAAAKRTLRRTFIGPALCVPLTLGGCAGGVLDPQGVVGAAQKVILLNSLAIMLAVVVPTILGTVAVAWWFRKGNARAVYRPEWEYSGQVELVVWAVPSMVVLLLAGIAWVGSHDLEPSKPLESSVRPIEVQVVSLDWKWLFIYPEQSVATVNRLVIPTGTPVRFRLTSATVMNSFFVPQLGSQIYTMPGMATTLYLQADQPGRYDGFSAQYSGEGFADMRFVTEAVSPQQFAAWSSATRGRGQQLDFGRYALLARPSSELSPTAFGAVAPGLFDSVVAMRAPLSSSAIEHHGRSEP